MIGLDKLDLKKNPVNILKYPFVHKGYGYCLDILNGVIPANIWVKGACHRFLSDLYRSRNEEDCPFYFNLAKAEKYLRIVQKFEHAVGHWEPKNIIYEPWQCFLWMNIKGWYTSEDDTLRFRTIHADIARGNSKSTMASQCTLYDLCCDEPNGNRIYCAATSRMQAGEVLEGAQIMARKNKEYLRRFKVDVMANEILHRKSNSFVKSISAQANNADGKIGKTIVTDELHAMKRTLFETLISGQSKRRDSQLLSITTAGYKNDGIGASQRSYAKKVAIGEIEDDTFYSLVYTVDDDDDYFAGPEVWIKANPNYGKSVDPVSFNAQANKAMLNPEDRAGFLIKHLNLYLDSLNQFFDTDKWVDCTDTDLKIEDFYGESCYVGVDLASTVDITSYAIVFKRENKFYAFFRNFVPEAMLKIPSKQSYKRYVEEGDLIATPGESINLPKFREHMVTELKKLNVLGIFCDKWNAQEMMTHLIEDGFNVLDFRMNTSNFSLPMKKLLAIMKEKDIVHNTKSMMKWCVGNVVAKYDANDNVFPRKEHEDMKIDPVIALIMAIAGFLVGEPEEKSVYEERGIRSI